MAAWPQTSAMKPLRTRLGLAVRRLRQRAGYSQESFADACGLHRTYMGSVERGERNISLDNIQKIAAALGISLSQLFEEVESSSSGNA
jgi:transcriptional regulator with XRE-family HTH domain